MSDEPLKNSAGPADLDGPVSKSRWRAAWEDITQAGLADLTLRLGTHILLVALILIVAWILREIYVRAQTAQAPQQAALAAGGQQQLTEPAQAAQPVVALPEFTLESGFAEEPGIRRGLQPHTDVPTRPRMEVIQYVVQKGDTVFGIAEKFGLKPETILWANQFVLGDNPHNLAPEQKLNILPVNGTYHRWSAGDGLNGVAKFFGVEPETIIEFEGNQLDPEVIGDLARPNIEVGAWLIVPGGQREYVNWSAPEIPRDNPGVASVLGPGACKSVSNGAVGAGVFIWPANNHFLSGFDYSPGANHSGIDIDGNTGDPVYAADNGVVVYAGWNNWGYGNVAVINHGNGWQTLYAHLDSVYVECGQSVYQTNVIGAIGSTGKSTGSHLHYEMMYNGTKVNPHDYLP